MSMLNSTPWIPVRTTAVEMVCVKVPCASVTMDGLEATALRALAPTSAQTVVFASTVFVTASLASSEMTALLLLAPTSVLVAELVTTS